MKFFIRANRLICKIKSFFVKAKCHFCKILCYKRNVKNNIFVDYIGSIDLYDTTHGSTIPSGFDFDYNCWYPEIGESNPKGSNDVYSNPLLTRTSGWGSYNDRGDIEPVSDFALSSSSSSCDDACNRLSASRYHTDYDDITRDP